MAEWIGILFVIALIVTFLVLGYLSGKEDGAKRIKNQAVNKGVARYWADHTGKTYFLWNTLEYQMEEAGDQEVLNILRKGRK